MWVVGVLKQVGRDVPLTSLQMSELMRIAKLKLVDGGTILTFCSLEQIAGWSQAGNEAGLIVEKNHLTGVKQWVGSRNSYAPHSCIINICEYVVVCHRQDEKGRVGFVNFNVDQIGRPFIPTSAKQNYIVNGNVMSLHPLARGKCCYYMLS